MTSTRTRRATLVGIVVTIVAQLLLTIATAQLLAGPVERRVLVVTALVQLAAALCGAAAAAWVATRDDALASPLLGAAGAGAAPVFAASVLTLLGGRLLLGVVVLVAGALGALVGAGAIVAVRTRGR